jgi:sec-independent protein translocase protein TatB
MLVVIGLLVLGPERLPRVASQVGRWVGRARRTANQLRYQIEREVALADIEESGKQSKDKRSQQSASKAAADAAPSTTESSKTEPSQSEPGQTRSAATDPAVTEAAATDPAATEPKQSAPGDGDTIAGGRPAASGDATKQA